MRKITCIKFGKEQIGLDYIPYPGELGQRIFDEVSQKLWQQWLNHQVMFINEHRLSPINPNDRKKIEQEMQQFLFEGGTGPVAGYIPES